MIITHIIIYKYSIPMHPFTIATGTMDYAQNILIKIYTSDCIIGIGECSAFPMIVGETQNTCFEMAKDFAQLWKRKSALDIEARMAELNLYTAGNTTIKSAFDMALYDIAAQVAGLPLYAYLGGQNKYLHTNITIGIAAPEAMAAQAKQFVDDGASILKIKLGKSVHEDVARVAQIRAAVGPQVTLRIDANQGWSFEDAKIALVQLEAYNIELCEQPMRTYNDEYLPELLANTTIKIMADESVYNHHDALRLIKNKACHYINIKMAKSGGILQAIQIVKVATMYNVPCMMGGMLESKVALTAFAHFAAAYNKIIFYDLDTYLLGHKVNPVIGGVTIENYKISLPNEIGIGARVDETFLKACRSVSI